MSAQARILVTGASGFLGAHVVKAAGDQSLQVHALVRASSDTRRLKWLAPGLGRENIHSADLTEQNEVNNLLKVIQPDLVVHSAAYGVDYTQQDLIKAIDINVKASAHLHKLCQQHGVAGFINVGTSYEMGHCRVAITPETPLKPAGIYGTTKAAQTLIVSEQARVSSLSTVTVRPFTLFGPLEGDNKLVPQLLNACQSGTPLPLTPGEQLRNFTYVADIAEAIIRISVTPRIDELGVIHLNSDQNLSLKEFGAKVASVCGAPKELLNWGASNYRSGEMMQNTGPDTPSRWLSLTRIDQAIAETIQLNRKFREHLARQ